jgi:hypothetical protein
MRSGGNEIIGMEVAGAEDVAQAQQRASALVVVAKLFFAAERRGNDVLHPSVLAAIENP